MLWLDNQILGKGGIVWGEKRELREAEREKKKKRKKVDGGKLGHRPYIALFFFLVGSYVLVSIERE